MWLKHNSQKERTHLNETQCAGRNIMLTLGDFVHPVHIALFKTALKFKFSKLTCHIVIL